MKLPPLVIAQMAAGHIAEDRGHATPCWIYQGCRTPGGYGMVHKPKYGTAVAHRAYYMSLVGPIPDGLDLDHLCRVRECVNPAHMEPVTRSENCKRGRSGEHMRARSDLWPPNARRSK